MRARFPAPNFRLSRAVFFAVTVPLVRVLTLVAALSADWYAANSAANVVACAAVRPNAVGVAVIWEENAYAHCNNAALPAGKKDFAMMTPRGAIPPPEPPRRLSPDDPVRPTVPTDTGRKSPRGCFPDRPFRPMTETHFSTAAASGCYRTQIRGLFGDRT